jgi:CubicO group peptidase (beta-lactamase class C family)
MIKCKLILLTCCLFFTTSISLPQEASLTHKLDSIKTKYSVMGMSVTVVKNNSIAYTKGFGLRDLSRNLTVNDSTKYRIASISKIFATTALMQLYEQGKFKLDEDVSRYLGFTLRNPNFPNDSVTFRHLLSHTAGIRDGAGYDNFLSDAGNWSKISVSSLMVPGGKYYTSDMWSTNNSITENYFEYSNINFGIAGTLVEKISGERFDKYCRAHIFQPLGFTCSFNVQDLTDINNVAVLYRKSGSTWNPQAENYGGVKPTATDLSSYVIGSNGFLFSPQGGLRASSNELAKFATMLQNGGIYNGHRILNDTTVQTFIKSNWVSNGKNGDTFSGEFKNYALANHTTQDLLPGETLTGHPGEAYGLISDMYFSRTKPFSIIFITDGAVWSAGTYSGWYNLEEAVYQACYSELNNLTVTGVDQGANSMPGSFILKQSYPNPFNPTATIQFSVPYQTKVKLNVYDSLGKQVASLINEYKNAGSYAVSFNANKLASGVYFYEMQAGNFVQAKQMVLLK